MINETPITYIDDNATAIDLLGRAPFAENLASLIIATCLTKFRQIFHGNV